MADVRAYLGSIIGAEMIAEYDHVLVNGLARTTRHRREARAGYDNEVAIGRHVTSRSSVFVVLRGSLFLRSRAARAMGYDERLVTVGLAGMLITRQARIITLMLVRAGVRFDAVLGRHGVREARRGVIIIIRFEGQCGRGSIMLASVAIRCH